MAPKLFGTDGVRGVAGEVLTAELAMALGHAAASCTPASRPQVLIVRDTRESGPMLEAALAAGVAQAGGDAFCVAGVLPTPAASVLVRRLGLDLAVVISASHNPWRDNGIKFFGADGRKLGDEAEAADRVGRRRESRRPGAGRRGTESGACARSRAALDDYLRELTGAFPLDLSGVRVVLDCANGATYRAAPAIFGRLGADLEVIADRARRPQHQRRLRVDPSRALADAGDRVWRRPGLRLRRRRRPGDRGRLGGRPSATATS